MIKIEVDIDDVKFEFPEIYDEFCSILKYSSSMFSEMEEDDLLWEYSWVFDNAYNYRTIDDYEKMEDKKSKMEFEERLNFELCSMTIKLTMIAGEFQISDELIYSPGEVMDISTELVKLIMLDEQKTIKNNDIIKSIPPVNYNNTPKSIIEKIIEDVENIDENITVDDILDKISKYGVEYLTKSELNFLNNQ